MTPQAILIRLLVDCFSINEFVRLVTATKWLARLVDELPSLNVSVSEFFHAMVDLLDRRGLIGPALFDRLREERPNLRSKIDEAAALWPDRLDGAATQLAREPAHFERAPLIVGLIVMLGTLGLAWRWPGRALIFLGAVLVCIFTPWSALRRLIGLAVASLICGSGLVLAGALIEARKSKPQTS